MAYNKLNLKNGTVLDETHLAHMETGIASVNNCFDFIGSDTVTWDGSMDGHTFVYLEAEDTYFCKISDAIPTVSDLADGGSFRGFIEDVVVSEVSIGADMVLEIAEGVIFVAETFIIIAESAANVGLDDFYGLAFPEAGVYCPYIGAAVEFTINGYTGFVTEKIKPSCLPNSIIFYAISDNEYLHKDASCAEDSKLTFSELKNATLSGRPMYVAGSLGTTEIYMLVTLCAFANDPNYGEVHVNVSQGNGEAPISSHFYTAEYTGT